MNLRTPRRFKGFLFILLAVSFSQISYAQLAVLKMIGKDSDKSKIGYGLFLAYNLTVSEAGNRVVTLELLDGGFFPGRQSDKDRMIGYISIKAGYRAIFSEEGKTGFFLEPQAGYCKVVRNDTDNNSRDGVAAALTGGYSLEVGERGSCFTFGLKYEADIAGRNYTLQSLGLRVAFIFSLAKR
ncbi:MAG: hypothetical protein J0H29_21445 [Sphingobacteriales bacterium]|nr:hypothetical protein [Sphingobacteriales bacterium]OJY86410.1 MAG: hypothetical protein BGP14_20795 [Sphingobacteriales bacterium 44-15]